MVSTIAKRRLRSTGATPGEGVGDASSSRQTNDKGKKPKGSGLISQVKAGFGLGLLILAIASITIKSNNIVNAGSFLHGPTTKQSIPKSKPNPGGGKREYVTAYLEPHSTIQQGNQKPLPRRLTSRSLLTPKEFPDVQSCSKLTQEFGSQIVNTYANWTANIDAYLPWIHDYFVSPDSTRVQFVSQNRRNCQTGKNEVASMEFWEPQMALFQPVPLVRTDYQNGTSRFRLYGDGEDPSSFEQMNPPSAATADVTKVTIIPETRFLCRFHWSGNDYDDDDDDNHDATSSITHSIFDFNYEYVSHRKNSVMLTKESTDRSEFWNSQLMFSCPIPPEYQAAPATPTTTGLAESQQQTDTRVLVDVIPIRTPARSDTKWLTPTMLGPEVFSKIKASAGALFDVEKEYGTDHVLPAIADSGRWANLPICPRESISASPKKLANKHDVPEKKPHRMVLCTWTSASYHRRGEEDAQQPLSDNSLRLREWLVFHKLAGFDHVYIYDNSPLDNYSKSPLYQLIQEFDPSFVTHYPWPATICNNNRPGNKNPGDRSSQYAAEASCRERYGPLTDWMAFIDTDEYLTPMNVDESGAPTTWSPVLDDMEDRGVAIMKFRSGRNLPRMQLMNPMPNQNSCGDPVVERFLKDAKTEPCVAPRQGETFLKVYNCDSVKRPRPERFQRAMKQIYRPDYVLSHFVHYSTVTKFTADYFDPNHPIPDHLRREKFDPSKEVFVDELIEGTLMHARSALPHETMFRSTVCTLNYKKMNCLLGYECPASVEYIDAMARQQGRQVRKNMNPHHDEDGNFCSCWVNDHIENFWIPKLEKGLAHHHADLTS